MQTLTPFFMPTMTPADFEWYYSTSSMRFDVYDLKTRYLADDLQWHYRFALKSMWGDEPPELEVATVANLQTSDPLPEGAALVGTNIRPGYDLGLFRLGDQLLLRPTALWDEQGEIEWVDAAHSARILSPRYRRNPSARQNMAGRPKLREQMKNQLRALGVPEEALVGKSVRELQERLAAIEEGVMTPRGVDVSDLRGYERAANVTKPVPQRRAPPAASLMARGVAKAAVPAVQIDPRVAGFPDLERFIQILDRHLFHSWQSDQKNKRARYGSSAEAPPRITEVKVARKYIKFHSSATKSEFSVDPATGVVYRAHATGGLGFPYGTVAEILARGKVMAASWAKENQSGVY